MTDTLLLRRVVPVSIAGLRRKEEARQLKWELRFLSLSPLIKISQLACMHHSPGGGVESLGYLCIKSTPWTAI